MTGDLVRHIFSAEKRYVERLSDRPLTDTASIPNDNLEALFGFGPADPRKPVKKFTKAHRRALEEYADLKISLEELRRRLAGVVQFDFQNHERRLDSHYGTPVPGVRIELGHIQAAMEKQAVLCKKSTRT
jgi:hypothetical protein